MRLLILHIISFCSQIFIPCIKAQENEKHHFFLESNYHYGFIWKHKPSLSDIAKGNIHSLNFVFGMRTFGKNCWDQLYRYPDQGIGYNFMYLGNPKELGKANALYYYLRIPLLKNKRVAFNYKISGGLAYLEQENIAIGSHINLYFDFCFDANIALGEKLEISNSFGATHYSNGAIKMPNLGLNLFSYRLGLIYKLYKPCTKDSQLNFPVIDKKNLVNIIVSAGTKEKSPQGGKQFTITSASVDYLRQLSLKHKLGFGFDTFYDNTLFELMNPDSTLCLKNKDIMRYGFHLIFESQIYRLILSIQLGNYIYAKYTADGKIYQRIALRYLLSKDLYANVSLKTSKGIADFVEWGFGYYLKWGN